MEPPKRFKKVSNEWQNILDQIRFWLSKDDQFQKAMDNFCKEIAPNEYSPIIERQHTQAFLDGFCQNDKALKGDFEYWVYEAKNMKKATVTYQDKTWDFTKDEEFVDYLTQTYPLKFANG